MANYEQTGLVRDPNAGFGRNKRRDTIQEKAQQPEVLEAEPDDGARCCCRWGEGCRVSVGRGRLHTNANMTIVSVQCACAKKALLHLRQLTVRAPGCTRRPQGGLRRAAQHRQGAAQAANTAPAADCAAADQRAWG